MLHYSTALDYIIWRYELSIDFFHYFRFDRMPRFAGVVSFDWKILAALCRVGALLQIAAVFSDAWKGSHMPYSDNGSNSSQSLLAGFAFIAIFYYNSPWGILSLALTFPLPVFDCVFKT
jgi:hypothetical protein